MMFDEDELQALVFGAGVAKTWRDSQMAEAAERILAKVDAVLPERLRPQLNSQSLIVPYRDISAATARMLGEATERIVWPLTFAYWGKNWTLGAWCELRQDFRNFRIDRLAAVTVLNSAFPDEPGKRLADYFAAESGR